MLTISERIGNLQIRIASVEYDRDQLKRRPGNGRHVKALNTALESYGRDLRALENDQAQVECLTSDGNGRR